MTTFACAGLVALMLVITSGCDEQHLTKCQELTSEIAEAGSAVMRHPLETSRFETVLTRIDHEIATLNGIPELDQAKADYKTKMREAILLAANASRAANRPGRIDANATARGQAAKATYHLMEATNLHCAGER